MHTNTNPTTTKQKTNTGQRTFGARLKCLLNHISYDADMVKKPHVPQMFKSALKSAFSKPATEKYPAEKPDLPPKYRGEPIFDYDACIGCGLCARDCPARAIEMVTADNKKRRPQVNLSKCVFCYQCAETCPKKCITYSNQYELATTHKADLVIKPKTAPEPQKTP